MSEYQYYEFLAIDHPLTRKQMSEVREFSTRAEITATRFVNEYNWGNFKGKPDLMVTRYFDLMYYYANWGTHRLLLGVPADGIDLKAWKVYASSEMIRFRTSGERVLIDFESNSDDYEDDVGESEAASLAPVRGEILSGDLRPLYLGWLSGVNVYDEDARGRSPVAPPGLDNLTAAQTALASFLRVDDDLLLAAAGLAEPAAPPKMPLKRWIEQLPPEEKDELLFEAASGEGLRIGTKLMQQYARSQSPAGADLLSGPPVKELLKLAEAIRQKRAADERKRTEERKAREAAKKAAAREQYLNELATREQNVWHDVSQQIAMKQSTAYESAIKTLRDLRDLAIRQDALEAFSAKVAALRAANVTKHSFIKRLDTARLDKR
ncbi:MAG TPA: hypothetical protein VH370_12835 [Humisphaera sp.]|jgi:hypothetical protein|nr:hypothetical protein [Humisphaera sp.]